MAPATSVTPERPASLSIGETRLFIDNTWVDPSDGSCFDTLNPATGEVIASVAQGGHADSDELHCWLTLDGYCSSLTSEAFYTPAQSTGRA